MRRETRARLAILPDWRAVKCNLSAAILASTSRNGFRQPSGRRVAINAPMHAWPIRCFPQVCGRSECCQGADPGDYIDSINARSASGLRIMVQRFFNSMMP
jgi:hypothetical protein